MDKTCVSVYLAIPTMPSIMSEAARATLYEALDELCLLSNQLVFGLHEYGVHKPTIELLQGTARNKKEFKKWFSSGVIENCEFVRMSVEVPFPSGKKIEVPANIPKAQREEFIKNAHRLLIRKSFLKRITDLFIMANIGRAGSLELKASAVLQDGVLQEYSQLPEMDALFLQTAVELSKSIGWPKLHTLEFTKVWKWITKHEDFLEAFDSSPTGRALNAFSRLLEPANIDAAMQLVWALMGIEAIYVRGSTSIMEQVRKKVQVVLGEQEAYKKKIVQMYNFRSRFIHGDLDFPGLYIVGDGHPAVVKYHRDQFEAVALAIAILIATIQELVQRDWTGINFSYKVSDSAVAPK